jgi:aerobic-type carbon monoxide dehydrogenase small subunit (CoxS/CutS family)
MKEIQVKFSVNGKSVEISTEPGRTLLSVLRDDLQIKSPKEACGQGDCGACVILMDGIAVNSCLVLFAQVQGAEVLTIEGLAENGKLHPLQQNFIDNWAFQCGYCTSGMLMSVYGLLLKNPEPTRDEIKTAIAGNLCRCTGYEEIIEAVEMTAAELSK